MVVYRGSSDVLLNFQVNVRLMKELKHLNAFVRDTVSVAEKELSESVYRKKRGYNLSDVDGLTFAVKDNLCTKDIKTTCSSEFLRNYTPSYTASVVHSLQSSGAIMMGKTNMDEFGMGSTNLYSCHGPVRNPWSSSHTVTGTDSNDDRVVSGGSSGGSAVAVASGMVDFALGSDTGGSVRIPASFCGTVGLKPTYGRVSRYGLIPLASSMDTIGVFSLSTLTAASVFDIISGWDMKDSTTNRMKHKPCSKGLQVHDVKQLLADIKIGVLRDCTIPELSLHYKSLWLSIADKLSNAGTALVSDVSLPHFKSGVPCYNVICDAEVASNMSKYSGVQFGYNDCGDVDTAEKLFTINRMKGLGPVVHHRIIAGMYFLSYHGRHYYEQALRVRQQIYNDFQTIFSKNHKNKKETVDIILTPVTLSSAPSVKRMKEIGPVESSIYDTYTVVVNLAGLPAISVPVGFCKEGLPLGLQVIGRWMDEVTLMKVARAIELIINS